jgi:hypothetical protein
MTLLRDREELGKGGMKCGQPIMQIRGLRRPNQFSMPEGRSDVERNYCGPDKLVRTFKTKSTHHVVSSTRDFQANRGTARVLLDLNVQNSKIYFFYN